MIEEAHKQSINSEIEKYTKNMEKEKESFSFIEVSFLVDMRIAENKYKEDFKDNIGGIKDSRLSFSQWLDLKKFEASKFHVEHSDYYLGF